MRKESGQNANIKSMILIRKMVLDGKARGKNIMKIQLQRKIR